MSKTITLRIEDSVYTIFKNAASGQKRTISNFIEYAAINFLSTDSYVSDKEMNEIENDTALLKNIKLSMNDVKSGNYKIVL